MQRREVEVISRLGLNAGACAHLIRIAAGFECDVSLMRSGRRVNGKSLMGVMMLAAGPGTRIVVETDGPDEAEAVIALAALIGGQFDETP